MPCVGRNGSVFQQKTGDSFLQFDKLTVNMINIALHSTNRSKIAWKFLIANQKFRIINQIDRCWRIGFRGKAVRERWKSERGNKPSINGNAICIVHSWKTFAEPESEVIIFKSREDRLTKPLLDRSFPA